MDKLEPFDSYWNEDIPINGWVVSILHRDSQRDDKGGGGERQGKPLARTGFLGLYMLPVDPAR